MNSRTITFTCPDDQIVKIAKVARNKLKDEYIRAFQSGLLELVLDSDLSGNDLRTFLGVLAFVGYENSFTMSLTALSAKLGIPRASLSQSITKLVKKGYLRKEGYQGQVNHYIVDPMIVLRARNYNLSKVVDRWDELSTAKAS